MQPLIHELVSKADLSPEQAEKVAGVMRDFLLARVPAALRGTVESALTGEHIDGALDAARSLLGGFLK